MSSEITLLESQNRILTKMKDFTLSQSDSRIFILKGYAGTGKTTLMRFYIQFLQENHINYQLLATTGRAAKVLTDAVNPDRFNSDDKNRKPSAITIHSLIYKYSGFNREPTDQEIQTQQVAAGSQLCLTFAAATIKEEEENKPYIYIIDEASMIASHVDQNPTQAIFGGKDSLLDSLLKYDTNPGSKFIFVGDPCQLPPVGENTSAALDEKWFSPHALSETLTEIVRQKNGSNLINLSQRICKTIDYAAPDSTYYGKTAIFSTLYIGKIPEVIKYPDKESFFEAYYNVIQQQGYNQTICICHSNKDMRDTNAIMRRKLGFALGIIPQIGDLMMVIQNNLPTHLVNGDFVTIENCNAGIIKRAGLSFVSVKVKEVISGNCFDSLMILDTLNSPLGNLSVVQQSNLFLDFFYRMKEAGIKRYSEEFEEMKFTDPYLNALRCNFGYAVTCHKSQGGEWDKVFLLLSRKIMLNTTRTTYRWLYTAFTRAKKEIHLVDDFYIK